MKQWATGVDSVGITRQITVGDIWECFADNSVHATILSFNGQCFEAEIMNSNTLQRSPVRIADFNAFVNNWQIVSFGSTGSPVKFEEIDMSDFKLTLYDDKPMIRCECGAHKLGIMDYAKGHSTWCKVYSNDA